MTAHWGVHGSSGGSRAADEDEAEGVFQGCIRIVAPPDLALHQSAARHGSINLALQGQTTTRSAARNEPQVAQAAAEAIGTALLLAIVVGSGIMG